MADKVLEVDFSDYAQRNEVMQKYSGYTYPFSGENSEGEKVLISVTTESIVVTTFQHNGWLRKNTYYANSYSTEEAFDGKWK